MTVHILQKSNGSGELGQELLSISARDMSRSIQTSFEATENEYIDQKTTWRSVFSFTTREHALTLILSFLLATIVGLMKPAIAIFIGKVFNDLTNFGGGKINAAELISNVSKWCIYITAFGGISWILNGVFFSMWLRLGELQAKSARGNLFDSMLKKEISWYDLRSEGIGALLGRIATQIRDLQLSASQPFGFLVGDLATACAAIGIAFYNSWKLTLVTLAGMPIAVVLLGQVSKQMKANIEAQKRDLTQASKFVNTAIISIDTVKVYNGQEHEVWQYASAIKKAAGSYLKQANSNALQMGITRFVIISMFVQGFWYGISLVDNGLSAGAVLTTFYACLIATEAAETLLPQWLVIARGMSAGATLRSLLLQMQNGKKIMPMGGSGKPTICFGDIEVTNMSFAYLSNPHQLALNNTSFFFPAGETTFVIGQSGSGKSTLSNLLLKFYEPSSGDISIDGESIQTLNATWLRQNITLVQQQSTLFDESMYQNIALGSLNPDGVTKGEIMAACQASLLQEVVNNLPEGLDTYVGAGGNSMSGGQKQRVALARARLRNTPILILDEATSALDQISRSLVMDALREWRKGKTTIIITHDISQVLENDYVYVLEHGNVVQEGYRRNLAQEFHGPFASFATAEANAPRESGSKLSRLCPTMHVEDERIFLAESSGSDIFDETYRQEPSKFKRISTLLGFQDQRAPINSRRVSYGLSSAYANVVRVEDSIAKDEETAISHSRPQSGYWNFSNNEHLWDKNISQHRPLSLTARTLGLRPQSITFPPPVPKRASFGSDQEMDSNMWKLPSNIPSGIEKEMMKRSGSITSENRRYPNAIRKSQNIQPPVDEIGRMLSPRRFAHRFDRVKEEKPKRKKTIKHKEKPATLIKILGTVWPTLFLKDRIILIIGFVFAFIHAAATPAFSYVLAKLLQVFYSTGNRSAQARTWSLAILAIAIIDAVATYFMHYLLEYCGQAWVNTLRVEALERILSQPRSWFDKENNNVSHLNECLDRNAEEMRNLVGRFAGYVFVAISMMSIAVIWSLIISWKLTLVGLSSAPFIWGVTRCFEYTSGKWESKSNQAAESAHRIFTETFTNIRVVRAFTLEKYFQDKYSAAILQTFKIGTKRSAYAGIFFGLTDSGNLFVTALIFYYAALLAARGELSVTELATVVNLLLFGIGNASAIMAFIPQISQSRVTATELLTLANLSTTTSHEALGKRRIITPLPIKLNSLSFTYPSRPTVQVLHNISITFAPGTCTAIVGSSGSGKSTIASLLLGLYPASPPSLLTGNSTIPPLTFAHHPITTLHTPTLRSHMAIVSQTPVLFPTTISENITYGLRSTSPFHNEFAIIQAAKDADIHDFIMGLPNGYQTVIGDGGMGLSGGQAQRIVIARALVRRPQVLILDEATSALDGESADQIRRTISRLVHSRHTTTANCPYYSHLQENIGTFPMDNLRLNLSTYDNGNGNGKQINKEENEGGMAVIIITHSIEMMRVAETIAVVDAGYLVEVGAFDELVRRRDSVFKKLVEGKEYRRDLETVVEVRSPTSPLGLW